MLASKGLEAEFPLFTAVHKVSHSYPNLLIREGFNKKKVMEFSIKGGWVCQKKLFFHKKI